MEPTEIEIDAGHIAPLEADKIPDANQSHHCFSCETPMQGVYCIKCGQKNDDYRRSLFSLIKEYLGSVTGIESRIWRTWAALLFKPGKVAREFADGRRTNWSSPVRVYLAMSIILFGFLSFTQTQLISVDLDVVPKDGVTKPTEDLTADDLRVSFALNFFERQKTINARNADRNFDLIAKKLASAEGIDVNLDTGDETNVSSASSELQNTEGPTVRGMADALNAENAGTGRNINLDDIDLTNMTLAFVKNPSNLNAIFYKWLPRIMFLMMPLTMIIGIVFIRGRGNALMYDHLVHAAYIHAVAFLLLLVGIVAGRMFPDDLVAQILGIAILLYLPISLKRMFGRSWIKTIWTSYGVGFIYALTLTIIMMTLMVYQVWTTFIAPAVT